MTANEGFDQLDGIAIIGMAGRFPGASNLDQFWKNLVEGVEAITELTDDQLIAAGEDPALLTLPSYVRAASVLDGIELFDADFFGLPPREALVTDPQHRIFLECAWEALEEAGYDPDRYGGRIGVFAGAGMHCYYQHVLAADPHALRFLGELQRYIAIEKDFLTTRVSYRLNLKGPSVAVQTACSTSLVAVHFACQSLLNGDSDMVLAGGVSIRIPQVGYIHEEGSILSPDGHCRVFDARAEGTVFGSGAGIVVLKRLADAIADGDCIRAVIRGSSINNDGALKVGYTAPSVDGQATVVGEAQAIAGVSAEEISYIETHGTGTSLGDPIEISALTKAFRATTEKKNFCGIGSLKSNLGHLDAAAGVAGLIKVVLALENRTLPPSLHFHCPNPSIDFDASPFYVQSSLSDWTPVHGRRLAGISSFGIGGTNAHVIVEEAPSGAVRAPSCKLQLLPISARTPAALDRATEHLIDWFRSRPGLNLPDAVFTLQQGRKSFPWRRIVAARSLQEAVDLLTARPPARVVTKRAPEGKPGIVFMFPAQGAQYPNMGRDLYESEPIFRENVDLCASYLQPLLGVDLRTVLYPEEKDREQASELLRQTRLTQPAVFTIDYALAQLWESWGITPTAMVGHSVGEYVAATLSGVFDLNNALALVAERGRLMQDLPPGKMLAVHLSYEKLQPWLRNEINLAAENAPELCVVSGPTASIEELANQLRAERIEFQPLVTSHAFHSAMMQPMVPTFVEKVSQTKRGRPNISFVSTLTGKWITPEEATDPEYWGQQIRFGVRFSAALSQLMKAPGCVLLEVGPGNTLSTFARLHESDNGQCSVVNSLRNVKEMRSDQECMLTALGVLWAAGVSVDWTRLHGDEQRKRVPLPTYPFERQRFWIDAPKGHSSAADSMDAVALETSASENDTVIAQQMELITSRSNLTSAQPAVVSRQEIEHELSRIWRDVLGVRQIDVDENFFDLGGQSLMAVTLINEMSQAFGKHFKLDSILKAPTIRQYSEVILNEQRLSERPNGHAEAAEIAREVRLFIVDNYPPPDGFSDTASFSELGIIDENSVLHLIAFLEETFGFSIPDHDLTSDNIDSIAKISQYVLQKVQIPQRT